MKQKIPIAEVCIVREEKQAAGHQGVLIVDDEPSVRKVIARVLRRAYPQCQAEEAGDLPQAKQKLLDLQPKLVISDLYLPSGNGLDLCHFIQKHPWFYKTRVLVITSYPSHHVREISFEQGACEFLPKPFHAEDLAGSIGRLLA